LHPIASSTIVTFIKVELHTNVIEQDGKKVACPYCGSEFKGKDELSKDIDRIHIGSGLFEGDVRKWL
jgi:DNA-directed RNA polymerase subunit RPC12/RpoP